MTNDEFKYWINGYITLTSESIVDSKQLNIIKNHANLVKEISGKLENSIAHFLSALDSEINRNGNIDFSYFQKLAYDLAIY